MADDSPGSAAEQAFRRHYGTVYDYLLRKTHDRNLAEELTQQVFADAVRALARSPLDSTEILPWLYTVARRRFADEARRRAHTRRMVARLGAALPSLGADEYGDEVARSLTAALEHLAPDARTVLVMSLFEGRSFAEIARVLGVSEPAARMRLVRALKAVRAELADRGIG